VVLGIFLTLLCAPIVRITRRGAQVRPAASD
jgi:hypothetical protein